MTTPLLLFLDLGDVLAKGIAVSGQACQRFRFPSVVAHRLVGETEKMTNLLLDIQEDIPRPRDFDPNKFPRRRSYPEGEAFLRDVPAVPRARFVGWQAVAHGADRQTLARHPTYDNIDALVHKAYLLSALEFDSVRLVLLVDTGSKSETILRYAESPPLANFSAWSIGQAAPQRVALQVQAQALDAATCAIAALPQKMTLQQLGSLLVIDIGYLRTKLYIVSEKGCEHQEELAGLGLSDCVIRILRDGQEQGLVEDEFAVIRALERSQEVIEVGGRRFNISKTLQSARRGLVEELARAAQAVVMGHYERQAKLCRAAAIIGGGAAIVGESLAARLTASEMGMADTWVCSDTSFCLLEGARKILH